MIRVKRADTLWLTLASVSLLLAPTSFWFCLPAAVAGIIAGRRMPRAKPAALIFALLVVFGLLIAALVSSQVVYGARLLAAVAFAGMFPWFVGRFWRQSQELVRAGWERAEQLEREQLLIAEQARLRERARIAQDMHDSLGHELSLIALRAGALKVSPRLDEQDRAAAGELRASAAVAVERLGEVIGLLREENKPCRSHEH